MKEMQGAIGPQELTNQANLHRLEERGNTSMAEGAGGNGPEQAIPRTEKRYTSKEGTEKLRQERGLTREQVYDARRMLSERPPMSSITDPDEKESERIVRDALERNAAIPIGKATWKNADNDQPIVVTGYKGKGPDGKDYASIEGSETGIPFNEIEYLGEEESRPGSESMDGSLREAVGKDLEPTGEDRDAFREMEQNANEITARLGLPQEFVDEAINEAKKEAIKRAIKRKETMRRDAEEDPERAITVPESLEDLAHLIMKRSGTEWRMHGSKPLIDKKTGRVNTVNFLDWTRQNLLDAHAANPTDPINFFSDISTSVRTDIYGGTISFYEITFGKHFFLHDAGDKGKVKDVEYEELRTQVLMETFILMLLRNPDISYVQGRGEMDKVLNTVSEAFLKNPITRGKFLEFILTLPSTERNTALDLSARAKGKELTTKKEDNFFMGSAVREALAAYINIYDYGQLQQIFDKDAPLFSKEWVDVDRAKNKDVVKQIGGEAYEKDKEWFNLDGSVKLYTIDPHTGEETASTNGKGDPHSTYMKYLNIFLNPNPSQTQQSEIRERIKRSLMKKEGISYREAELAELYAYSMTHIHGISARNDTDSIAFDWWTRTTNFRDYRRRQKAERRGAKYGSKYNMDGLKRIGLNYFEAARDVNGHSIREIIQGGTGRNIDMSKPIKDQVDFNADLQKQFVPNHLRTAAEMYEWLISSIEMDFPSMVTGYDSHGNAVLDWKRVNEVKEKLEHDDRYMLSTWNEINFEEENVEWERMEVRNTRGRLVARTNAPDGSQRELDEDYYVLDRFGRRTDSREEPKTYLHSKKMTRLESMFGTDALEFIKFEIEKRNLAKKGQDVRTITDEKGSVDIDFSEAKKESADKGERFRTAVWRGVFDYLVASEIASHRDRGSGNRYYNYEDIKKMADVLRDAEFMSPDEIKHIRKETGTRARKTYLDELGYVLATGGFEGFWNAFRKVFLKELFK